MLIRWLWLLLLIPVCCSKCPKKGLCMLSCHQGEQGPLQLLPLLAFLFL